MLRGLLGTGGGRLRWSDWLVTAGLIALVVFTPFAFGAVYQGAFTLMETGCFALVIVWMWRVWAEGPGPARMRIGVTELRRFTLPAAALFALMVLQITPLPSRALRVVSPAAYQVYAISFPGWPGLAPYQTIAAVWSTGPQPSLVGPLAPVGAPPARALRAGSKKQLKAAGLAPPAIGGRRWRTIALAPSVTASALIEAAALAAVFLLLLVYPFGFVGERDAEQRFYVILLGAIIATATGVALLGLLERAWWNGRIMWFFVPQDWGGPLLTDSPRGSGPFVDPDHFANYLAMVLPLAAVGALFPMPCVPSNQRANVRFLCAGAAIIIAAGIVTSMSRGGWIVATLGSSAAIALALRRASARAPALLIRMGTRLLPTLLLGGAIVVALMLYLLGPAVRTQLGERVGATVAGAQNLQYKPRVWADTLQMVHEFPVFGVGLGCWPEIFPHYQRPPWSPFFYREAENDYLQFFAETGLAGLALVLWLGLAIGLALRRAAGGMQERSWPLYAGLIGGVGAAVLHEAIDFSFHTPANALLFAILLALTLRIAFTAGAPPVPRIRRAPETTKRTYLRALAAAGAAAGFIVFAYVQDGRAYPYATGQRRGLVRAAAELAAHPAMAATHLMLVAEMPRATSAALRLDQLHAAVWLDPNQPGARDLYAQSLLLAGRAPEGLAQVSLAVYRAPQLNEHYYLEPRVIPWLLPAEQEAIARGFNWAVQARFDYAAKELGSFYAQLGRYREAGTLEVAEAHEAVDDSERANYLVRAGRDYESAGDIATAARVLKQASASDPTNPQPYAELAKMIYGPEHDFPGADAVVRQGIANGADPYMLEMAVANTAMAVGDDPAAEKALLGAIRYQPSFEAKLRLGEVYMNENRFDRAALTFQQAIDLKPDSAQAYDALGRANEGAYNYFEAAKAYRRATELAPSDRHLRQNYHDFEQRTAESAEEAAKAAKGNGHAAAAPAASPVTDGDVSGGADSRPLAPTPDTNSQP